MVDWCGLLYLWRRCEGFADSINMGRRKLRYPESRKLLAVLSACWTDLPYLPENFVWEALTEKDNREICAEMYNLSIEAILARVPESMVYAEPRGSVSKSVELVNGEPVSEIGGEYEDVELAGIPQIQPPRVAAAGAGKMQGMTYRGLSPASPDYAQLKEMEDRPLEPIPPLEPLTDSAETESTGIRVVSPVDMFGGSCFAE